MPSKDMQSKAIHSRAIRFGRKVARSLLPGVASPDFSSRACVVLVVGKAIMNKHCLANSKDNEKCLHEVTAKAVLQSFEKLFNITSDDDELQEDLEEIAVKCICKREFKEPHSRQAPKIAEDWIARANAAAMWESENFFKQE